MKNMFLLLVLVSLPSRVIGQDIDWFEYNLDSITIEFPTDEVFLLDTIIKDVRIKQLAAYIENSSLVFQKTVAEQRLRDNNLSSLPNNYEALMEYYDGVLRGMKDKSNASRVEKSEIKKNELIGYQTLFYNTEGNLFFEAEIFLIERDLIIISCFDTNTILYETKERFFNSFNFDNLKSLNQYTGVSKEYRQGYIFGKLSIYVVCGIVTFILIRSSSKKKKKQPAKSKV